MVIGTPRSSQEIGCLEKGNQGSSPGATNKSFHHRVSRVRSVRPDSEHARQRAYRALRAGGQRYAILSCAAPTPKSCHRHHDHRPARVRSWQSLQSGRHAGEHENIIAITCSSSARDSCALQRPSPASVNAIWMHTLRGQSSASVANAAAPSWVECCGAGKAGSH